MFYNVIPISKKEILKMTKAYLCENNKSDLASKIIEGGYSDHQVKMYITDLYMSKDIIYKVKMEEIDLIVITRLTFNNDHWQTKYALVSEL